MAARIWSPSLPHLPLLFRPWPPSYPSEDLSPAQFSASKFPRVLSLPAFRSSLRCHFSVTPWRESQLPSHFLSPLSASVFLPRACRYLKDNKFYSLISFAYCLILIRTGMFVSFLHCRPWSTSNKAWIEFKEIALGQDKTNKAREISDRRQIPAGSRGLVITQIPGALREILIQDVRNGVWTSEFLTGIPVIPMQPAESSCLCLLFCESQPSLIWEELQAKKAELCHNYNHLLEEKFVPLISMWASLVAQTVKNLPAMQETQVQSLGWEYPLERKWQPTPVFLPGEFHGQRSLVGYIVHGVAKSWIQVSD